jgi:hypothetical protein
MVFKAEVTVIHVILSHLTAMIITKMRNYGKNGTTILDCGRMTSSLNMKESRSLDT